MAGLDLLLIPWHQSLCPTTWVAKKLAQFGVRNVNGQVLLNGAGKSRNLVAQGHELDIGEISANPANY
jgi:2-keto-4-pentenoate hydratase